MMSVPLIVRNMLYAALIWGLFTALKLVAHPEQMKFRRLTIEDGLSQSSVFGIGQDRTGFMWFGTTDGLNRFDGYEFVQFRYQPGLAGSISSNRIYAVYVDRRGSIWIGTGGNGLNRYDPLNDAFIRYSIEAHGDDSGGNNFITAIHEDQPGNLWIGTRGSGVYLFDRQNRKFLRPLRQMPAAAAAWPENITGFTEAGNKLWVASEDAGMLVVDLPSRNYRAFEPRHAQSAGFTSEFIPALLAEGDSVIWIGTFAAGLYKYHLAAQSFLRFPGDETIRRRKISAILRDNEGVLWIGTSSGLYRLDETQSRLDHYQHDPNQETSLNNDLVISLFEDRSGCLWVGTEGNGIAMVKKEPGYFHVIDHMSNQGKGLNSNIVNSIVEDDRGYLWVGSDKGFNRINRETGEIESVFEAPGMAEYAAAMSVAMTSGGAPWLGTFSDGLFVPRGRLSRTISLPLEDPDRYYQNFRNIAGDSSSLSTDLILSLYFDRSRTLWIGTDGGGLNQLADAESGKFICYKPNPLDAYSINDKDVWSVFESAREQDSILWVGTASGGLNKFNRKTGQFTSFKHDEYDPYSISANRVYVIHEGVDGSLWLGTDAGVNKFDRERETFEYFGTNVGFPNDVIYGILEDSEDNLWFSTNSGLVRFNPYSLEVKTFSEKDGLPNNEFNSRAYYKNERGECFFGSLGGLVYFRPEDIPGTVSTYVPPVVITRFERYNSQQSEGTPIVEKGISEKEHLHLTAKDNILTFEFAALNYRNIHKVEYAYFLEGFTENWIQLGTQRRVTFTNLDPGSYTLRVMGSNHDGIWNEEGTSLRFTIHPPWWQSGIFYTLLGMLGAGLLLGIRQYEMNRQRLRYELEMEHVRYEQEQQDAERLKEMDRQKSRFFANISHEFRTPLTLIQGPAQRWIPEVEQPELCRDLQMIHRNTQRLLRLVNQLMDIARLESGKTRLKAEETDIGPLTRQLVMAFESMAAMKKVGLKVEVAQAPILVYADREKYEKIIVNLVSNAIKFTQEGGAIIVDCGMGNADLKKLDKSEIPNRKSQTSEFVRIRVKDTGIGIPAEKLPRIFDRFYQADDSRTRLAEGTGIGLALTKELVELHHWEISVESEPGKGTTFMIQLPLGKEHFRPEDIADLGMRNVEIGTRVAELSPVSEPYHRAPEDIDNPNTVIQTSKNPNPKSEIILIVEDNPDMRAYISNHLENGYRVLEAENGVAGLKHARRHQPDLIISDVMMPQMDGFRFCEEVKTDTRISHIPVILLTAKAVQKSRLHGLASGADDYLTKPFDAEELRIRVKNLIEQRRQLRERFRRETAIEPGEITVTSADAAFLERAVEIVENHITRDDFDTATFARKIGLSRSQLNIKLRAITGCSTRLFIRTIRLKRAAQLLEQGYGNVAEIAYEVGFSSLSHFSKIFEEHFGVVPSKFGNGEDQS